MPLSLHTIRPTKKYRQARIRVGRGNASGLGTTAGRGGKGQRGRTGGSSGLRTRALRQSLVASLPKSRGFQSSFDRREIVDLTALSVFADGALITPNTLKQKGLVRGNGRGVKILSDGVIKVKLTVSGCLLSAGAKQKIEAAGGTVTLPA